MIREFSKAFAVSQKETCIPDVPFYELFFTALCDTLTMMRIVQRIMLAAVTKRLKKTMTKEKTRGLLSKRPCKHTFLDNVVKEI